MAENEIKKNILKTSVCIPVDKDNNIDFKFIETFMRERGIQTPLWSVFKIGDLFESKLKIHKFSSEPEEEGKIPFITSTSSNNGVNSYINEKPSFNNKCLTISTNGKCFDVFLQDSSLFCVSSDVEILYNKIFNSYHYLFVAVIIKLDQYRWGYGRKPKNNKVFNSEIILPITDDGKIHLKYMEQFIKSLPYSKYI